jgi:DNA-binding response OmpR family regulator
LILSGYGDTEKVIYGLNIGADDYLSKPFVPEVLLARIQALLRRPRSIEPSEILSFKGITLTPSAGTVEVNHIPIQLTRKEFFILEILLRSQGKVVNREDLIAKVWGHHPDEDISLNTVNVTLSKLRRKLGR